jgi:hypothetical protein
VVDIVRGLAMWSCSKHIGVYRRGWPYRLRSPTNMRHAWYEASRTSILDALPWSEAPSQFARTMAGRETQIRLVHLCLIGICCCLFACPRCFGTRADTQRISSIFE